ncbi:hypothetical protein FF38_01277 [Lucilia cuprina]|uniref:Uncharacterized protein n=1 Tax=Lucilia cuprina TaxID=7375 RepID=A0A0L0BUU9_LUCCU|nr:hypothetical protein FF38_01277 [Lucilia cuprina]
MFSSKLLLSITSSMFQYIIIILKFQSPPRYPWVHFPPVKSHCDASTGHPNNFSLRASKALNSPIPNSKTLSFLLKSVNGLAIVEKSFTNLLKYEVRPRKLRTECTLVGTGKSLTARRPVSSALISLPSISYPKYITLVLKNSHLSNRNSNLLSTKHLNTSLKIRKCFSTSLVATIMSSI